MTKNTSKITKNQFILLYYIYLQVLSNFQKSHILRGKNLQKSRIFRLFCFYMKIQGNSADEKVIFYVGKASNSREFLSNSTDFSSKFPDFLENIAFLETDFQLKFNFFQKSGLKKGKIQLKICNILRGKKRLKVINYVEEGLFNVEFGLF